MRRELARSGAAGVDVLRAKLHEAVVVLARQYATAHRVEAQRPTHRVVSRFQALVERDASHRRRVADYAAELAVTPGHLSVLCEQYAGRRAKRIVADALLARARRMLLYTDESAARVGASLGFDDASYFTRFFRRETGQTPTAFRRGAGR
jgi:AraC family transcriptional activator of pobA